jgi:hypothetical protein
MRKFRNAVSKGFDPDVHLKKVFIIDLRLIYFRLTNKHLLGRFSESDDDVQKRNEGNRQVTVLSHLLILLLFITVLTLFDILIL